MRIVQCLLRSEKSSMFCFLRDEERLKVGALVQLDQDCRTWTVEAVANPHDFFVVQEIEEPL